MQDFQRPVAARKTESGKRKIATIAKQSATLDDHP